MLDHQHSSSIEPGLRETSILDPDCPRVKEVKAGNMQLEERRCAVVVVHSECLWLEVTVAWN